MAEFEPKQFGKFFLLDKLAVGGMAEIYKAKTFGVDGFEKLLAIKRILPHCAADKDFITMLIDEAKLSVLLSHANIVQVYDLGKVGDDYFISMEYINGVNLRDLVYHCREYKRPIPLDIAVFILSEICKGLDYAHRKTDMNGQPLNLVHRDISPQNILISYEGEVKIVDFGIAKAAMNISHTMAGILKGKIAYMSPEQALGKSIDHRTDIFSTGILLYECLTGEKLFSGESQFEVLKKIRSTKMDLSRLPATMPKPLQMILARALAYFPKDRFQSAGDMQIELTKHLYSTYHDFSPQKLAAFVREAFAEQLAEQKKRSRTTTREIQTGSVNLAQGSIQEEIVHRVESSIPSFAPKRANVSAPNLPLVISTPSEPTDKAGTTHTAKRLGVVLGILVTLATVGLAYRQWVHPLLFPSQVATPSTSSAIAIIDSTPAGAHVFLDTIDTGQTTPTRITGLQQGQSYQLKLSKPGFLDLEQPLIPSGPETTLNLPLAAALGTLQINSTPAGATILLDGQPTGKTTPATLSDISLNAEHRINLHKEGFSDFDQIVTLSSDKPQSIEATLLTTAPAAPTTGTLRVTSNPPGVSIWINGTNTGQTTPATLSNLDVTAPITLSLQKEKFATVDQKLSLQAGDNSPIFLTLTAEAPPPVVTVTPTPLPATPVMPETKVVKSTVVTITSTPSGAKVSLDGRSLSGVTPLKLPTLDVGSTHTVSAGMTAFKTAQRRFTVNSEKPMTIALTLKPETPEVATPLPTTPAPITPPPAPTPAKTPPIEVAKPVAPEKTEKLKPGIVGGTGTIKVNSDPGGADVFINGEMKGTAPVTVSVPSGSVKVMLNKEGLARYSTSVSLNPGETKNLGTLKLGSVFGEVAVSSTPPHASVFLDGNNVGATTPVTIRKVKRDRPHMLRVTLDGYATWERAFSFSNDDTMHFNANLEAK